MIRMKRLAKMAATAEAREVNVGHWVIQGDILVMLDGA